MAGTVPETVDTQVHTYIASGEYRGALELVAQTYLNTVYRYCLRMLHNDPARANDVTQQVFEEVCKGIATFRGEASIKTWLLAIARHQCLKDIGIRARRRSVLQAHSESVEMQVHTPPPQGAEVLALSEEGLTRLQWALTQLLPEERSVLVMRFGIGVSHELSATEIAQVLGLSRAGAYRKLHEALARLRRIMHDDAG
jgi:RNA polymerase sigma-70 factor (ECF subfamily)